MGIVELFVLAVGLSMDAFAVSICKGLSLKKIEMKHLLIVGLYFGVFQAGMPLAGYLLGNQFSDKIVSVDHWIAFGLLLLIGGNMIKESLNKEEEEDEMKEAGLEVKAMLILAVATSIDALAVGVTFAFLQVQIFQAVFLIGITTFILSVIGVKIGNVFGARFKSHAELAGGIILVILGAKILLEHTNFIG